MENFDRKNIDELLEIRQIRQYFSPSKFCAIQQFVQFFVPTQWVACFCCDVAQAFQHGINALFTEVKLHVIERSRVAQQLCTKGYMLTPQTIFVVNTLTLRLKICCVVCFKKTSSVNLLYPFSCIPQKISFFSIAIQPYYFPLAISFQLVQPAT